MQIQYWKKAWCSCFLLVVMNFSSTVVLADEVIIHEEKKLVTAGWLERVIIEPWNIKLRAKLDTGAKTSSLHALDIERFDRDGEQWVRFHTIDPTENSPLTSIELPLVRDVRIKRHRTKTQVRPVVNMTFCMNGNVYTTEFSLIDRGRFNYPVLLGRSMLQQGIIIDPSVTFTLKTNQKACKKLFDKLTETETETSVKD